MPRAFDPDLAPRRTRPARRGAPGARNRQRSPARIRRARAGGSVAALGLAIGYIADYKPGTRTASQHVTDVVWIAELGIHYKLGDRRPERVPGGAHDAAVRRRRRSPRTCAPRPAARAPAPVLLPLHARRVGGARRVPGAGPGAVRGLLRPDADPVLLPGRRLGHASPRARAGDDQARDLHVRRLAADARRGDRHRRARLPAGRRAHHLRAVRAAGAAAQPRLPGVDLPVLRRRVPGEDARLPAARLDARRLPGDADRGADGLLRRALEGRRVRLPGDRAAAVPAGGGALPDADADHRADLDPLRLGDGVHPDRRAPDRRATPRLRSSASSRWASSR